MVRTGGTVRLGVVGGGTVGSVWAVGGGAGRVVGGTGIVGWVAGSDGSTGRVVGFKPVCLLGDTEVVVGLFVTVLWLPPPAQAAKAIVATAAPANQTNLTVSPSVCIRNCL
jgi:hypothetical protein